MHASLWSKGRRILCRLPAATWSLYHRSFALRGHICRRKTMTRLCLQAGFRTRRRPSSARPRPSDRDAVATSLAAFVARPSLPRSAGTRGGTLGLGVVCVTSVGTTVPLEQLALRALHRQFQFRPARGRVHRIFSQGWLRSHLHPSPVIEICHVRPLSAASLIFLSSVKDPKSKAPAFLLKNGRRPGRPKYLKDSCLLPFALGLIASSFCRCRPARTWCCPQGLLIVMWGAYEHDVASRGWITRSFSGHHQARPQDGNGTRSFHLRQPFPEL
ncbi:uncharacterized protein LOC112269951 isoform X1 [Brachypodium distachyon]|uniref:uncharacterized protein LOC112269951 isoform X1 n=1 Tax=Brachypodium distachyon TaxID=15368 RepID=UPI000D0D7C57|nr:uncharacterized protein LOC112269951 isoform X1 [Brachypodium distachyon]|eukprot:XP_024313272.1 uncharacterized protein LOC112269951 isoform X1 [Brachypodium distachyon]